MGSPSPYTFKDSPFSSHSRVLSLLPAQGSGLRVLDVGCGPGYLFPGLAARGFEVTGIDRNRPETLPQGVGFVAADLNRDLPSLEAAFDFVLLADVLEHLDHPERVVAWALRCLKPDGRLVISVPNVAHIYVRWKLLWGAFDYQDRGILDRTHVRFFTRKSFVALLHDCGLVCLEMHTTPAPLELLSPMFGRIGALHAALARSLPGLLAYQFVCVAADKHGR